MNRNKVPQTIALKGGSKKTIFHEGKFPTVSFAQWWKRVNESPKPNSKRQKRLAAEAAAATPEVSTTHIITAHED